MGRGVASRLAAEGVHVFAAARRADRLDELAASHADGPGSITPVPTDVVDRSDVDALFDRADAAVPPVDIVVSTAGTVAYSDFADQPESDWDRILGTNLTGALRVTQAALARMLPRNAGRIVQFTSVAATTPIPGMAVYSASKAAVSQFLAAVRGEYGTTGVRITEFEVGATEGTEMGRGIRDYSEAMMERMVRFAGADQRLSIDDIAETVVAVLQVPQAARLDHVRFREPSDIPS